METINPSSVFDELNNTMEKEGIFSSKPLSVDNSIEFDKWLEDKKQRYLENKEECYNDILSSTTSAIDQFLKSPHQAQKGVLESAVKCNEMFLAFVDNSIDVEEVISKRIDRFHKMYLAHDINYIDSNDIQDLKESYYYKGRRDESIHFESLQPKAIEDNVWDEVVEKYKTSMSFDKFLGWLQKNYILTKKQ